MTTRVGNYGVNQQYISLLNDIQARQVREQTQVSTLLKSQKYSGIATDAYSALTLENQRSQATNYIDSNSIATTRLDSTETTLTSIQTTINNFKRSLDSFASGNTSDPLRIQTLQTQAFNSMIDMANYLNFNIGGTYVFSGGRTDIPPVDLAFTTLQEFQKIWDGSGTTVPTTRTADLAEVEVTATQAGAVTFDSAANTITAANADAFANVQVGSTITIGGMVPDVPVTVTAISTPNRNVITVQATSLANETATGITVTVNGQSRTQATTGDVVFASSTNTLTAADPTALVGMPAGTVFDIANTTNNNGTYVVARNIPAAPTKPETAGAATITYGLTTATAAVDFGTLIFGDDNTITCSVPGWITLSGLQQGDVINVSGTGFNDRSFVIDTVNAATGVITVVPSSITVQSTKLNTVAALQGDTTATIADASHAGAGAITNTTYGSLTFSDDGAGNVAITAGNANAFAGILSAGGTFTIVSTPAGANDAQYKILANNGSTLSVSKIPPMPALATTLEINATIGSGPTGTVNQITSTLTGGFAPGYGTLSFGSDAAGQMTLTATQAGAFTGLYAAGDMITVSGSSPGGVNDGCYWVVSTTTTGVLDDTLTLATTPPAATTTTASVSASPWYQGDGLTHTQQINAGTSVNMGITANDPTFEKAYRAMALIAQGAQGTPGGLGNNSSRISAARYLLGSALQVSSAGAAPFGAEKPSNMDLLLTQVGLTKGMVKTSSDQLTSVNAIIDGRLDNIEKIDQTTAITNLLSDNNALQASYQSLSRLWSMSLLNYLK